MKRLDKKPSAEAEIDDVYDDYEADEYICPVCEGTGGDPLNDFCLPCPECGQ